MSAKQPTQPPQFAAGAFAGHAGLTAADIKNFQSWKRWVGGELEYDGSGLRDVVAANATFLSQVKTSLDGLNAEVQGINERVTALENRPQTPFPGSS